jgi:hypothetical protein
MDGLDQNVNHINYIALENSNSLKDYVKIGTYKDLTIKTTGTSISFIVKWENTLHELIYNTNDVLMFRISSDNGQTWTTKKQI